jgi:predicted NBD/HSP70 family sugar kinase
MAIDEAMSTAMLGTFRDLLADVRGKGLDGADVEEMAAALSEMESLAARLSDVGEFSTTLANGGYYTRFTDAYTRVMIAAGGGAASADGNATPIPADADLLAQALGAYDTSLTQLRGVPDQLVAVAALERILEIGRSGVTYPRFLRQVEDEALNDVLAGSVTPTREQLVADLELITSLVDPPREALASALIGARDELAAATGFADPFAFELRRFELSWQHAPAIATRDALVPRLTRLVDLVVDWLDSQTSWAAHDQRFQGASAALTRENIERAHECNPGFYEIRSAQFAAYFGAAPWWERPELAEERRGQRILWTDARLALAVEAVTHCTPDTLDAPAELVARAEAFGPNAF